MGDGRAYADPKLSPRERPAGDPDGRREPLLRRLRQRPLDLHRQLVLGDHRTATRFQLPVGADRRRARASSTSSSASRRRARTPGKVVFVVMHMPTQDPGDQSYRDTIARMHTMGKGTSPDNGTFESIAAQTGVDGVFLGHIKGQFLYRGEGDVPYYIDGGAGGELYTDGPVGTDHGYWHGFRLVRVDGERIVTDTVPIFVKDGIRIEGPASIARGKDLQLEAFGRQPVFNDPAKVEALELRDPDPRSSSSLLCELGLAVRALARATGRDLPAARHGDRRHAPPPRALRRDPGVAHGTRGVRRRRGGAAERADLDAQGEPADAGPDLDLEQPERPGTGRVEGRRPAP